MLVYEKYENKQPVLYGTMANIPADDDEKIKYVDGKGDVVTFDPTWLTKGRLVDAGNGRFNILGANGKVAHQDVAMVVVTPGVDVDKDGVVDKEDGDVAPEDTVVTPIDVTDDETAEAGAGEGEDNGDGPTLD